MSKQHQEEIELPVVCGHFSKKITKYDYLNKANVFSH